MPDSAPRLCSWDSTHVPPGSYTTANAAEVLPGITPPLSADLWREWDYVWTHGVLEDLEVLDLVDLPKPPGSTMMPFIGGRFVLNIGLNMAYTATFSVGEGSDLLKQFVGDEGHVTSGAAADQERAAGTRERIIERWERSEASANIASRKEERAFLAEHELPVMFDWPVELIPKDAAEAVTSPTFEGQGISPGSATGKARDRERGGGDERRSSRERSWSRR